MIEPRDPRFLNQDPCTIFLHGGCHAFAIELADQIAAAGKSPQLYCLRAAGGRAVAHVVVGTGSGFYDALGGPQTEAALKERYVHREVGAPELVRSAAALTTGEFAWSTGSGYGHVIDPGFVAAVRAKAKAYIAVRPERFGLAAGPRPTSAKGSARPKRPIVNLKLSAAEQNEWLKQHLPHRIRSVLPGIRHMEGQWKIGVPDVDDFSSRSVTDSVNEGRHSGMRWLIFFVGIMADSDGWPKKTTYDSDDTDVWIERLDGGKLFDDATPEAAELARLYRGCTQATGHPTRDTNHPPIDVPELARGMKIILRHLHETIYRGKVPDLEALTLRLSDAP